jgi:hypothetical protein
LRGDAMGKKSGFIAKIILSLLLLFSAAPNKILMAEEKKAGKPQIREQKPTTYVSFFNAKIPDFWKYITILSNQNSIYEMANECLIFKETPGAASAHGWFLNQPLNMDCNFAINIKAKADNFSCDNACYCFPMILSACTGKIPELADTGETYGRIMVGISRVSGGSIFVYRNSAGKEMMWNFVKKDWEIQAISNWGKEDFFKKYLIGYKADTFLSVNVINDNKNVSIMVMDNAGDKLFETKPVNKGELLSSQERMFLCGGKFNKSTWACQHTINHIIVYYKDNDLFNGVKEQRAMNSGNLKGYEISEGEYKIKDGIIVGSHYTEFWKGGMGILWWNKKIKKGDFRVRIKARFEKKNGKWQYQIPFFGIAVADSANMEKNFYKFCIYPDGPPEIKYGGYFSKKEDLLDQPGFAYTVYFRNEFDNWSELVVEKIGNYLSAYVNGQPWTYPMKVENADFDKFGIYVENCKVYFKEVGITEVPRAQNQSKK